MGYGILLRNAAGVEFFNTDTITWNYVGSFIAAPNSETSKEFVTLSFLNEVLIQTSFVDGVPGNQEAFVHSTRRSGNRIIASSGNVRTLVTVLGR